jgi:flagellar basal body-associated protein FliL
MTKKLAIPLVLLAAAGGGAYAFARPSPPPEPEPKVHGQVYVLPRDFVINLADERLLRLTVGLLLDPEAGAAHGAEDGAEAAKPPEGFGPDPQEALIREIVVDELTGVPARRLATPAGRARLKGRILAALQQHTDVPATHVLFTDMAVQ